MPTYSKKTLAKGAVELLDKHSLKEVALALAHKLKAQRATRDVSVMASLLGEELFKTKGHLSVHVVSAHKLSVSVRRKIERFLKQSTKAKTVGISYEVDKALIGGIKIVTPVGVFNMSITHTLHQLTHV